MIEGIADFSPKALGELVAWLQPWFQGRDGGPGGSAVGDYVFFTEAVVLTNGNPVIEITDIPSHRHLAMKCRLANDEQPPGGVGASTSMGISWGSGAGSVYSSSYILNQGGVSGSATAADAYVRFPQIVPAMIYAGDSPGAFNNAYLILDAAFNYVNDAASVPGMVWSGYAKLNDDNDDDNCVFAAGGGASVYQDDEEILGPITSLKLETFGGPGFAAGSKVSVYYIK